MAGMHCHPAKRRARTPAIIIAGVLAASGFPAGAHEGEEDGMPAPAEFSAEQQAVADVLAEYAAAFQNSDIAAIRALTTVAGGFSFFEGTFADFSWDSYAKHLGEEMPLFAETAFSITNVRPEIGGGMAFATYDWALDVVVLSEEFEGGRHPVAMRGVGTAVFVPTDAGWKIRHIHTARATAPAENH